MLKISDDFMVVVELIVVMLCSLLLAALCA
jgi:hypothetical protein